MVQNLYQILKKFDLDLCTCPVKFEFGQGHLAIFFSNFFSNAKVGKFEQSDLIMKNVKRVLPYFNAFSAPKIFYEEIHLNKISI